MSRIATDLDYVAAHLAVIVSAHHQALMTLFRELAVRRNLAEPGTMEEAIEAAFDAQRRLHAPISATRIASAWRKSQGSFLSLSGYS